MSFCDRSISHNAAQPIVCWYFWVLLLAPHQNFSFLQRLNNKCVCSSVQCAACSAQTSNNFDVNYEEVSVSGFELCISHFSCVSLSSGRLSPVWQFIPAREYGDCELSYSYTARKYESWQIYEKSLNKFEMLKYQKQLQFEDVRWKVFSI